MPQLVRHTTLFPLVFLLLTICLPGKREAHAEDSAGATRVPLEASASQQAVVTAIGVVTSKAGTQITINGNTDLNYKYFIVEGQSLVIDIPGAKSNVWPTEQKLDDEFVSRIQVAALTGESPVVRVVLALKKTNDFTVTGENGRIVVFFAIPKESASPGKTALNRVLEVTATRIANVFRVAVKTDAKPSYRVLESDNPKRITVAIDGAAPVPGLRKDSDYSSLNESVTRVATSSGPRDAGVVLVAIDVRQPLPFQVVADGHGLTIDFSSAVSGGPVPSRPVAPAVSAGPLATDPAASSAADPARVTTLYAGRKITLDFVDADIADIFRLIAEISQMNIIASDDVKGKRSVKMTDVPWDQALDLILKTNIPQLAQIPDGENVLRIVTISRLTQEQNEAEEKKGKNIKLQEDSRRLIQFREAALEDEKLLKVKKQKREEITATAVREPLQDYIISLKNSEMADVKPKVFSYLEEQEVIKGVELTSGKTITTVNPSPNAATPSGVVAGSTQLEQTTIDFRINETNCPGCLMTLDNRTKTFFFKMYPLYMEKVLYIVNTLDTPKKIDSVLIEARIVEVVSDFSQSIGIQWGGTFAADAAHGNATKYAFPNTIGISGTQPGNYLVNLPASGAVSGIGLSLGHIANTLSLDARLSAMEMLGKTKILSNPKILTLNNMPAKINIGSQLPMPRTTVTGERSVEWKDVGILLNVTPEITSDDKVVMKVTIEKSSRGATVPTTEGDMFSIERRGAETNVIVVDGETTVIGGIYIQSESGNNSGVPGLSKIPLLGWLFKSRSNNTARTELMIFLTPKINRY